MSVVRADGFAWGAVLGVVKALLLDLPAALGQGLEAAPAAAGGGKIAQPVCLPHRAVRLVLPRANHPHGFPTEGFPRLKIVGVPDGEARGAVPERPVRRLRAEAPLPRRLLRCWRAKTKSWALAASTSRPASARARTSSPQSLGMRSTCRCPCTMKVSDQAS